MAKKALFIINDIDFMLKVWEKAKANGKKAGDSVQEEFDELLAIDPGAVTYLGDTEKDIDMLTGELRENGAKVVNLAEVDRRAKLEKSENSEPGESGS